MVYLGGMNKHPEIWYHGECDKAGCVKVVKHKHWSAAPLKSNTTHRPRMATLTSDHLGGMFTDTLSVGELIERLSKLPVDSRVAVDENEVNVITHGAVTTVVNSYQPEAEDFDRNHRVIGTKI